MMSYGIGRLLTANASDLLALFTAYHRVVAVGNATYGVHYLSNLLDEACRLKR
jgi:hypothetical protein